MAFSMASGFMAWVFEDMRDSTVRSQLGHVQIVRPHYFDKGIADPYNYLLNADEKMRRHFGGGGRFGRFRSLLSASGETTEDGHDDSGRYAASDHRLTPILG